ncbi:hypothetical protein SPBR_08256 [Sporothrix brasiliensis 5110]|uniref:Uncharacterized protein n=1 Tax=Sporothrix brasiliensis 5110 TaxID=1398154 RepID=A0A0C2IPD9_9PEZI|nr:uncharacterized protein SPBR_08256 [Sporothrix brasiliensis 5110]KIH86937.1 hypothetical protein SPBR_08256 [Sporothrix brasiliensis 5110]
MTSLGWKTEARPVGRARASPSLWASDRARIMYLFLLLKGRLGHGAQALGEAQDGLVGGVAVDGLFREGQVARGCVKLAVVAEGGHGAQLVEGRGPALKRQQLVDQVGAGAVGIRISSVDVDVVVAIKNITVHVRLWGQRARMAIGTLQNQSIACFVGGHGPLAANGTLGDDHLVLGQGASLVGADNGDGAERLDGAQRLAEDAVLAHHVGTDGHAGGEGDGQALGHKGDGDGDGGHDEAGDGDPLGVVLAQPRGPDDDDQDDDGHHDGADDGDKVEDLALQRRHARLGLVGEARNAAKDGAVARGHDDAGAGAGDAVGALQADAARLQVVVVGGVDGGGQRHGLARQDGAVKLGVGRAGRGTRGRRRRRHVDEAHVGRQFVAGLDHQHVAGHDLVGGDARDAAVAQHQRRVGEHGLDGAHDAGAGPVLPHVEEGLDGKDGSEDNGEGQVGDGRVGIAERLPGDEDEDGGDEQHGAEALEEVAQDLARAVGGRRRGHVLAVLRETAGDLVGRQARLERGRQLHGDLLGRGGVPVQVGQVGDRLLLALVLLVLLVLLEGRALLLGVLVDVNGQRAVLDGQGGGGVDGVAAGVRPDGQRARGALAAQGRARRVVGTVIDDGDATAAASDRSARRASYTSLAGLFIDGIALKVDAVARLLVRDCHFECFVFQWSST